jgi:hypothetical protein
MTRSDASKKMGYELGTTIRNPKQWRCIIFQPPKTAPLHSSQSAAVCERPRFYVHGYCNKLKSTYEVGDTEEA